MLTIGDFNSFLGFFGTPCILLSTCFRFSVRIKYGSGKFSKIRRISLPTNHPVHF